MRGRLNSTQVFLAYALPVLEACFEGGDVGRVRKELEDILISGREVDDEFLRKYFPRAIERRNEFARERGIEDRHEANVRYWEEGHNAYVGEACGVYFWNVERIEENKLARIAICDGGRAIVPHYHFDLRVGDKVSVHGGRIALIKS